MNVDPLNQSNMIKHYSVIRLFPVFVICVSTVLLMGCKENNPPPLEGCCNTPGINATVGDGHFYVANVITSNGDGINDLLWPACDDNIVEIVSFQIRDHKGKLVYEVLNQVPGSESKGWDGQVDGQWKEGVYNVRVKAEAADGTISVFDGNVCNYRCRNWESGPISSEGCHFPVQTTDGRYDPNIPSFEDECFE